uniref:Uncharacterized protein n=1 Tax=Streptomyces sp. NBC_00003 TaxID=2903608 RepID=A0AAU2V741_9ACTN
MPTVPVRHAQLLATTALKTWPATIGLEIEFLGHNDRGPEGVTSYAALQSKDPGFSTVLLRVDGYEHVSRGCEETVGEGNYCWAPSAAHLSLREPGLCTGHLQPLRPGDWVTHPERSAYGVVRALDPAANGMVVVDFGDPDPVGMHTSRLGRVPGHVAVELNRTTPNVPTRP